MSILKEITDIVLKYETEEIDCVNLFCEYQESGRNFVSSNDLYVDIDLKNGDAYSVHIGYLARAYNGSFSLPCYYEELYIGFEVTDQAIEKFREEYFE